MEVILLLCCFLAVVITAYLFILVSVQEEANRLKRRIDIVEEDYCTWFPDLWWSDCCAVHDATATNKNMSWLKQNWFLAKCVWASSYSVKNSNRWWKVVLGRYVAPVLMFLGTSTFGWIWRFKAL